MADAGTATFKAIADFNQLRREAQGAATDLDKMRTSGENAGGGITAGMDKAAAQMGRTGRSMTTGITLPVVALGAVALKTFADFDTALQRTAANAGATGEQQQRLHDLALEMGAATQFSAEDAANAMFELSAAGVGVEDIMGGAIQSVLLLAGASGASLPDAASLIAQSMNAFGIGAENSAHVADVLTQAANQSAIDVTGLAQALSHAGQLGATANQDLESVVAVIQSLANQGVPAAQAGTAVAQAMQSLKSPTKRGAAALAEFGIEVRNADGSMKQLPEIMVEMEEGFKGVGQAERDMALDAIFGVEGMKAMGLALNTVLEKSPDIAADAADIAKITEIMGQEFVDAAKQADGSYKFIGAAGVQALDALNRSSDGVAATFEEKLGKTTARQLESLKGSLETLAIVVIEAVVPALSELLPMIIDFVNMLAGFAKANPELVKLGIGFLLLLATVGPVLIVLSKVISAISLIAKAFGAVSAILSASPIGLILIAIAVAGLLIWKNWDKIKGLFSTIWAELKEFGQGVADFVGPAIEWLTELPDKIVDAWNGVKDFFTGFWENLFGDDPDITSDGLFGLGERLGMAIRDGIAGALGSIGQLFSDVWASVVSSVGAPFAAIGAAISTGLGVITSIVRTATGIWVTAFGFSWTLITNVFRTAWAIIGPIVQVGMALVGAIISVWLTIWQTLFTVWWAIMSPFFQAAWIFLSTVVTSAMTIILTTLQVAWAMITFLFQNGMLILTTLMTVGWAIITTVVQTAMMLIGLAVSTGWSIIQSIVQAAMSALQSAVSAGWAVIQMVVAGALAVIRPLIDGFKGAIDTLASAFGFLADKAGPAWDRVKSIVQGAADFVVRQIDRIKSAVDSAMGGIGSLAQKAGGAINTALGWIGLSSGGQVPGTGNRDSVPAMLTPGEYVIRKAAVRSIGLANLARLNRRGVTGYSGGGYVSAARILRGAEARMVQRFAQGGVVESRVGVPSGRTVNQMTNINVVVNNPVGEPVEESLHRQMQKLAIHGVLPDLGSPQ